MNALNLDLLREKMLQLCRAASRFGIGAEKILRTLQRSGWDEVDAAHIERELRHLSTGATPLIAAVPGASLTPALVTWATTPAGDHELERRGLL